MDGTGYTENMVIQRIGTTELVVWKGQYDNSGTTMMIYFICMGS